MSRKRNIRLITSHSIREIVETKKVTRMKGSKKIKHWVVAAHAFNPRTQEAEAGYVCEFKTNLI